MEGENRVFLMGKPEDGGVSLVLRFCILLIHLAVEYVITMPSMYARGILFGKMVLELGDSCTIRNERTGMHCDVDFKTKVGVQRVHIPFSKEGLIFYAISRRASSRARITT
jgi:hypothetical protein